MTQNETKYEVKHCATSDNKEKREDIRLSLMTKKPLPNDTS